jgi:hypothetical protein
VVSLARSIHLWSTTPGDDAPDWLMDLIKKYAPSSW